MGYVVGKSERIIIKIGEQYALSYVLKAVSDNRKVKKFRIFEGHHRNQLRPVTHEITMARPGIFEVWII